MQWTHFILISENTQIIDQWTMQKKVENMFTFRSLVADCIHNSIWWWKMHTFLSHHNSTKLLHSQHPLLSKWWWLLSQPHSWKSVGITLTLPKWGLGSLPGFLKLQSSIIGAKRPHIETFFISLEIYQSVDVENGPTWAIWTSAAQVMAKGKVGSQTGNLTFDH